MVLSIEIKKGKQLSDKIIKLMADSRIKEYGENSKNVKKDELESIFFFVKDRKNIVAFGMLKPIKINYLDKKYNIYGIASILSIIKGKGYGLVLMEKMLKYLKSKEKSAIGFFGRHNLGFYKKTKFKTKKNLCNRFFYDYGNQKKNKEEMQGDALYYEGKDKFITKVLSSKSKVYISIPHW